MSEDNKKKLRQLKDNLNVTRDMAKDILAKDPPLDASFRRVQKDVEDRLSNEPSPKTPTSVTK